MITKSTITTAAAVINVVTLLNTSNIGKFLGSVGAGTYIWTGLNAYGSPAYSWKWISNDPVIYFNWNTGKFLNLSKYYL